MKTSERLLAALRHTDDDILDLDREIHFTEDQLARLRALRSLLDQVARLTSGEVALPTPGATSEPPASVSAAPPVAAVPVPAPERNGKGHALSTVLDPLRNPPSIKQPAEQWLPALIERVRECIRKEGPATRAALRLRLKCGMNRLKEALHTGPFERREGLYHLRGDERPGAAQVPTPTRQVLYPGNRTAEEVLQAAAFVLEEAGEPVLLSQIAEDIGVTGQELLPLLRDHPWFAWQANQGWSLTPEGTEALALLEAS